jgi:hypothetical protein
LRKPGRSVIIKEQKRKTTMTLEEFTAEFEALQEEGRDKEATILATLEEELYTRYWVEVCGEELE